MATIDWATTRDGFRFALQSGGFGVTVSLGDSARSTALLLSEATVHSLARALNDAGYGCGVDVQQAVALDERKHYDSVRVARACGLPALQAQQQAALAAFNVAQCGPEPGMVGRIPPDTDPQWRVEGNAARGSDGPAMPYRGTSVWPKPVADGKGAPTAWPPAPGEFVQVADNGIGLRGGDSRRRGFWSWLLGS
ncbi:MAG TPA: hypothetical protein VHY82_16005 [Acetobacteraceae bacterium]|jgi:hypothetical protein|nr:hypothetical protein [Acetobacteraceae bacterium]